MRRIVVHTVKTINQQQLLHFCSAFEHKMYRLRRGNVCILMFTLLGALVILRSLFTSIYYTRTPTIVNHQHFVDAKRQYNLALSYSNSEIVEVPIIGLAGEGTNTLIQTNNLQNVIFLGYKCGSKLILTNERFMILQFKGIHTFR